MPKDSFFSRLTSSFHNGIKLLKKGHVSTVGKELLRRLYSTSLTLGLRRDLNEPFQNPDAKIDISLRPLKQSDIEPLMEYGKLAQSYPRLAAYQHGLVQADLPTCYVAVTNDDTPCYMQWLIGAHSNQKLKDYFGDIYPELAEDQALLEGAYMRPTFRGQRIMPAAMSRIATKAKNLGARWVITFVGADNVPSLKGCKRAGFSPYVLRKERWLFFRQHISFHEIPDRVLSRYHQKVGRRKETPANKPEQPTSKSAGTSTKPVP